MNIRLHGWEIEDAPDCRLLCLAVFISCIVRILDIRHGIYNLSDSGRDSMMRETETICVVRVFRGGRHK